MTRTARIALVIFAIVVILIGAYCVYRWWITHNGEAVATCPDLEHFHSQVGVLNMPAYTLGKVIVLNEGQAQPLMTLPWTEQDIAKPDPPRDTSTKLDTTLKLEFNADVPETIKADVRSTFSNALSLTLKNMVRTELAYPLAFGNASTRLKERLKELDASSKVALVSSLKRADSLEIKLHDKALGEGEGSLIEVGNYKIMVKLECHGLHTAQGNGTGMFYGVNSIAYDRSTDKIVSGAPVKVWEWDHTQTYSGR